MVLDRLENAGFVRRERICTDRCSVIIRTVPCATAPNSELYKPIIAAMEQLVSAYDAREMSTIVGFFERANRARRNALDPRDSPST